MSEGAEGGSEARDGVRAPAYDPNLTCGEYGGRTHAGKPCPRPAGWQNEDVTDPGCRQHSRVARLEMEAKKGRAIEIVQDVHNIRAVATEIGVAVRTIFEWRRSDPEFKETFDGIWQTRDKALAAEVEDKVFDRIMADKASPAETIFFLKNRDPDRWKDVYDASKGSRNGEPVKPLASADSARSKLSLKLKQMAERGAATPVPPAQRSAEETVAALRARGEEAEHRLGDEGDAEGGDDA
jgi:hypothetical protein